MPAHRKHNALELEDSPHSEPKAAGPSAAFAVRPIQPVLCAVPMDSRDSRLLIPLAQGAQHYAVRGPGSNLASTGNTVNTPSLRALALELSTVEYTVHRLGSSAASSGNTSDTEFVT